MCMYVYIDIVKVLAAGTQKQELKFAKQRPLIKSNLRNDRPEGREGYC